MKDQACIRFVLMGSLEKIKNRYQKWLKKGDRTLWTLSFSRFSFFFLIFFFLSTFFFSLSFFFFSFVLLFFRFFFIIIIIIFPSFSFFIRPVSARLSVYSSGGASLMPNCLIWFSLDPRLSPSPLKGDKGERA